MEFQVKIKGTDNSFIRCVKFHDSFIISMNENHSVVAIGLIKRVNGLLKYTILSQLQTFSQVNWNYGIQQIDEIIDKKINQKINSVKNSISYHLKNSSGVTINSSNSVFGI